MKRIFLSSLALAFVGALAHPGAGLGQDFPLSIETRFGTTVIEDQPERVATVDYAGADNILALGLQPLTARAWFGPFETALWPWAQARATKMPSVLSGALNYEQIAATDPDVILALRSGITADDYAKLSLIAPVVAVPPGRGDYDLDWEEQALLAARALGRTDEARTQIDEIKSAIAHMAQDHPDWAGKTFAMMTYWNGAVGLYAATDSTVQFISSLGLAVHPKVAELSSPGQFYIEISEEILPELDADIVFWYAAPDSTEIAGLKARAAMRAPAEGREVFLSLESLTNGAISHGSLLSLPEALKRLPPKIDAALDGDPETTVPFD